MAKKIKISDILSKHKKRLDRGGQYVNYLQGSIGVTILIAVLKIKALWVYVLGIFIMILIRYVGGLIDEKTGTLKKEQKRYSEENPVIMEIFDKLNEINKKL